MTTTMAKARDGRVTARENELQVLRALHRFGWLRTRDLAALLWQRWAKEPTGEPGLVPAKPTAAGLRMAQRTVRRLRETRQVLDARAPDGSIIYALAEGGVRRLKGAGITAISGKNLMRTFSSTHFRHRCIANEVAIGAIVQGFRVSTERETAQGRWLGGESGVAGKVPDVLLRSRDRVWWVEVERSRKNAGEYARLLLWLGEVGCDAFNVPIPKLLGDGLRWGRVVFVCTPTFQARLLRDLAKIGWKRGHFETLIVFSTALYRFEDIIFR